MASCSPPPRGAGGAAGSEEEGTSGSGALASAVPARGAPGRGGLPSPVEHPEGPGGRHLWHRRWLRQRVMPAWGGLRGRGSSAGGRTQNGPCSHVAGGSRPGTPGRARLLSGARRRQSGLVVVVTGAGHVATAGFGLYLLEFDLENENGPTSMILALSHSPFSVCMCARTCTHTCLCMCVYNCVCVCMCVSMSSSAQDTHTRSHMDSCPRSTHPFAD